MAITTAIMARVITALLPAITVIIALITAGGSYPPVLYQKPAAHRRGFSFDVT